MRRNIARAMIILSAVLWGTSFPVIRVGLMFMSPIVFLFLRFSLATLILFSILLIRGIRLSPRRMGGLVGLAGIMNAFANALQFVGQKYTYATNAALMINTSPIFTAISAHFLIEERLTKERIGAIAITFIGAGMVILGSATTLKLRILGDLICLLAGAIWGIYVTEAKKIRESSFDELELLAIWFLYVAVLGGLVLPFEKIYFSMSIIAMFAVIYTAVMCTVLPFLLWYKALRILEASTSSNYFMLEIVVSAVVEMVFIGLLVTPTMIMGAIMIIIGVYLTDYFYTKNGREASLSTSNPG